MEDVSMKVSRHFNRKCTFLYVSLAEVNKLHYINYMSVSVLINHL